MTLVHRGQTDVLVNGCSICDNTATFHHITTTQKCQHEIFNKNVVATLLVLYNDKLLPIIIDSIGSGEGFVES